jgi:hypothetical protein
MKREQFDKRKRKGRREGGTAEQRRGRHREKEKRGRREWGLRPPFVHHFVLAITPFMCISPHLLVKNPLPVDVGIVGRTTSNIVFIVVFSLPQACVSSD